MMAQIIAPAAPRSAEHGFALPERSAEHGFTLSQRSAEHGFTSLSRSAENGFTLIELMISLLIFGMLASAGVALLSFSTRAQSATIARLGTVAAEQRISALMIADMAQVVRRTSRDVSGAREPAFAGGDGRVLFAFVRSGGAISDVSGRSALQRVTWRVAGQRLERVTQAMVDGAAPLPPLVLADRISAAAVRFRDKGEWRPDWSAASATALPRAVELTVTRAGEAPVTRLALVGTGY